MARKRIGDMLIERGYIVEEQLKEALELQKKTYKGRAIGEVLVDIGFVTEEQLARTLGQQLGMAYVDLNSIEIPENMASVVSKNMAKQNQIVPIQETETELFVAMGDPTNFYAFEQLRKTCRKRIKSMIATPSAVERAISVLYGSEGMEKAIQNIVEDFGGERAAQGLSGSVFKITQTGVEDTGNAPTIHLVNSILERAVMEGASDIHIEPRDQRLVIRLRCEGVMRNIMQLPKEAQAAVIARIKIMAGIDVVEKRIPQDGRFSVTIREREVDMRVSTLPITFGEKIVIRLLDKKRTRITKELLGLRAKDMEHYDRFLSYHNGVLLLVGPTGSGKSTTMYSMINDLNTEDINLVTLEDPVEYQIEGVNQVQINEKVNMTFESGLVAILRQDPDIVAVGEIRNGETAEIAMRAALTGRYVLSTIHTNDAVGAIERLKDIGVEDYLIASTLRGVISQRLVRRICPHCKKEYVPKASEFMKLHMKQEDGMTFSYGEGCSQCFQTGYSGRIAIFEILSMSPGLRELIGKGAGRNELEQYLLKKAGW